MPQFERRLYDPAEDLEPLEGDEIDDEGSRLPLLIVIALVVLASFAGVVWLAYTQGVQRGREDVPAVTSPHLKQKPAPVKKNPYAHLEIYQPRAASKDAAAAPPLSSSEAAKPQTAATSAVKSLSPPASPAASPKLKSAAPSGKLSLSTAPAHTAALPRSAALSAAKPALKSLPPPQTTAASAGPRQIAPAMTAGAKPAAEAQAAPGAGANRSPPLPKGVSASATPETPPHGSGGYVLQIGSYTSAAEANASWQKYKLAHSSVAGYGSDVKAADLGSRGTWYRLRIGPFPTLADANAACARLKAQGGNCFPAKR